MVRGFSTEGTQSRGPVGCERIAIREREKGTVAQETECIKLQHDASDSTEKKEASSQVAGTDDSRAEHRLSQDRAHKESGTGQRPGKRKNGNSMHTHMQNQIHTQHSQLAEVMGMWAGARSPGSPGLARPRAGV